MGKSIIKTPNYVNKAGIVRVDFWTPDFDALVDNKGYDVIWERAIPCPCGRRQTHMSVCQNCMGTGWVFLNPTQIKAVAQSINKDTKYKEWSQERLGTASFTVRSDCHLNFMDKLTLLNSVSRESENLLVKTFNDKLFISTIYPVDKVVEIFKFDQPYNPLVLLPIDQVEIKDHFITLPKDLVKVGDSLTITYEHKVQYHIIDLNHDVRNSIALDNKSQEQPINLPISAIGRRVHNVIDALNYTQDNLFDNSYGISNVSV